MRGAQFCDVPLEVLALERGRAVALDEQEAQAVREVLLGREEAGEDALPEARVGACVVGLEGGRVQGVRTSTRGSAQSCTGIAATLGSDMRMISVME